MKHKIEYPFIHCRRCGEKVSDDITVSQITGVWLPEAYEECIFSLSEGGAGRFKHGASGVVACHGVRIPGATVTGRIKCCRPTASFHQTTLIGGIIDERRNRNDYKQNEFRTGD